MSEATVAVCAFCATAHADDAACPALRVLDGFEITGQHNVDADTLVAHVRRAIRRGHPQVWRQPPKADRVVLVGGGPSLDDTVDELRALVFGGALLVTVNGAYAWCLARNLKPHAQIVLDARASNARFLSPAVPGCRYYLASQCHPDTWDAVEGRPFVGIFHALEDSGRVQAELDRYYLTHWHGVTGGTTVLTRALGLLRLLGYLRFDLFGADSCWLHGQHHAYAQRENQRDKRLRLRVAPVADPARVREFECAPWHLKQFEDFVQLIRFAGQHFLLQVHGNGLLAYALSVGAALTVEIDEGV